MIIPEERMDEKSTLLDLLSVEDDTEDPVLARMRKGMKQLIWAESEPCMWRTESNLMVSRLLPGKRILKR